eukprot:scaffold519594_cov14-Prasinocladus_malaysianus.AAC.1
MQHMAESCNNYARKPSQKRRMGLKFPRVRCLTGSAVSAAATRVTCGSFKLDIATSGLSPQSPPTAA